MGVREKTGANKGPTIQLLFPKPGSLNCDKGWGARFCQLVQCYSPGVRRGEGWTGDTKRLQDQWELWGVRLERKALYQGERTGGERRRRGKRVFNIPQ